MVKYYKKGRSLQMPNKKAEADFTMRTRGNISMGYKLSRSVLNICKERKPIVR